MPRQTIAFGGGLDRTTGVMEIRPAQSKDLQNVYLVSGKMEARRGNALVASLPGCDDVLLIHAFESTQEGVAVGYVRSSGTAKVYITTGEGTTPVFVADWFTGGTTTPPRVIAAEVGSFLFLAHDEPSISARQNTVYYDPTGPSLNAMSIDLGGGAGNVKFRGVVAHLDYLVGWGYGNVTEPNRPDMVRISLPGQPLNFEQAHYVLAGVRNDPILSCVSADSALRALKRSKTYILTGYDRSSFGIFEGDKLFGIIASRAALVLGQDIFYWSLEGPRAYMGGPSQDISLELGLPDDEPTTLPDPGDENDAFVAYEPVRRLIHFVFGQRVYTLHTKDGKLKWSYTTLGFTPQCAGILYTGLTGSGTGGGVSDPPTAFASDLVLSAITASTADLSWSTNSPDGDEWYEVWIKPEDGEWVQFTQNVTSGGATDTADLTGLTSGITYTVAVRYRRGSQYTSGYEVNDGDSWPVDSREEFDTLSGGPSIVSAVWSRTSAVNEQIALELSLVHTDRQTEVLVGGVVVETLAAGVSTYLYNTAEGLVGESSNQIKVRHTIGGTPGVESAVTTVWSGPSPRPSWGNVEDLGGDDFRATWINGSALWETEVWDNFPGGVYAVRRTEVAGVSSVEYAIMGAEGDIFQVKLRHRVSSFGIADYSDYSTETIPVT